MRNFIPVLYCALLFVVLGACNQPTKKVVLAADREAPLGWVRLTVYSDSSFEFTSSGLRSEQVYPGTIQLRGDTIHFHYRDSVPAAGSLAIISKDFVRYVNGKHPESLKNSVNTLRPKI